MSEVIITPRKNGPYHIQGNVKIVTPDGRVIPVEQDENWLCRCGHSAEKPFCDGSHKKLGFQSDLDATPLLAAEGYDDVCADGEVVEGQLKGVEVAGAAILIGRVQGKLYAMGGLCSHADALLEDGELDGFTVSCPLHDSGFDIRTGQVVRPPAVDAVPVHDVMVEGGRVYVARVAARNSP